MKTLVAFCMAMIFCDMLFGAPNNSPMQCKYSLSLEPRSLPKGVDFRWKEHDYIQVYDSARSEEEFFFVAEVESRILRVNLDLVLRDEKGSITKRSKNLKGRDSLMYVLEYFGSRFDFFEAIWFVKQSDNYKQYKSFLEMGLDKISAAELTWTGSLLTDLGYQVQSEPQLQEGSLGIPYVKVLFKKPK